MSSSAERVELTRRPASASLHPRGGSEALDAYHAEARERAAAEAFAAGRARAIEELANPLAQLAERLELDARDNADELSRIAADLGCAIARELMKIELVAGNHDIERMVRATLSELRTGRDACEVHLHPEDAERLAKIPFGSAVAVLPDTRVRRGDVVVSSPQGQLVRSLDEGLAAVAQALRAELSP